MRPCAPLQRHIPGGPDHHKSSPEHHGSFDPVGEAGAEHAARFHAQQKQQQQQGGNSVGGGGDHFNGDLYPYFDDDGAWSYGDQYDEGYNGGFNSTERLLEVFPLADADDDGKLTKSELVEWTVSQHLNFSARRLERELHWQDQNEDGLLAMKEYLTHTLYGVHEGLIPDRPEQYDPTALRVALGEAAEGYHWLESMQRRFRVADADQDGLLSLAEFADFHHPQDTTREEVLDALKLEEVERHDKDGDGFVDWDEYRQMYETEIMWERLPWDRRDDSQADEDAKVLWHAVDTDGDDRIDAREMGALLRYVVPSDRDYAVRTVEAIMQDADEDGDGALTIEEMLANPASLYSFPHSSARSDPSYTDYLHDSWGHYMHGYEFR